MFHMCFLQSTATQLAAILLWAGSLRVLILRDGSMENVRNVKMPSGGGAGRLAQLLVLGGAAVYGVTHSLFNVEGGHR